MTGRLRLRPAIWAPALALGLVVIAIFSLGVGAVWLPPDQVARALLIPHSPDAISTAVTIVWDLRLARVLLAALVGATSIFADAKEDYPQVSAEAIVSRDPAVIVGPSSHGDKLTPDQVAARPGWDKIRAVRDGRIALIDGDMVSRPGPRLADALESLANALYPAPK